MTRSSDSIEGLELLPPAQSKPLVLPLILTVFAAIVGSILLLGAGAYYMVKTGRLNISGQGGVVSLARTGALSEATHAVVLEPLVVNLADEGGRAYLRLGLTLRVAEPNGTKPGSAGEEKPAVKGASESEASVRDIAFQVLGNHTSTELLAPDGKLKLKAELKAAIAQQHPDIVLHDMFFTEFLVQR